MNYRVHIYVSNGDEDGDSWVAIRRETKNTDEVVHLREGVYSHPDIIAKTLANVGVDVVMYSISDTDFNNASWENAKIIPEKYW